MPISSAPADVWDEILADKDACVLAVNLIRLRLRVRSVWVKANCSSEGFVLHSRGVFCGDHTFIPYYGSYVRTWADAGMPCPFDVEWSKYDDYENYLSGYLATVVDTLDEQVTMWGADEGTTAHPLYGHLKEFARYLKLYYEYKCVGVPSLVATVASRSPSPIKL